MRPNQLSLAIALAITSPVAFALDPAALPDVGNALVTYGDAVFSQGGNTLTVDTKGSSGLNGNTVIQWGGVGFNVGSGASVTFDAKSADSIILNHDISGDVSRIHGDINAPVGNIVLVNANGIEHTGGGQASLTLIQARAINDTDTFGLDRVGNRVFIDNDFDYGTPTSVISNVEGMTKGTANGFEIDQNANLAIHTNASSIEFVGAVHDRNYYMYEHIHDSKFAGTHVKLNQEVDFAVVDRSSFTEGLWTDSAVLQVNQSEFGDLVISQGSKTEIGNTVIGSLTANSSHFVLANSEVNGSAKIESTSLSGFSWFGISGTNFNGNAADSVEIDVSHQGITLDRDGFTNDLNYGITSSAFRGYGNVDIALNFETDEDPLAMQATVNSNSLSFANVQNARIEVSSNFKTIEMNMMSFYGDSSDFAGDLEVVVDGSKMQGLWIQSLFFSSKGDISLRQTEHIGDAPTADNYLWIHDSYIGADNIELSGLFSLANSSLIAANKIKLNSITDDITSSEIYNNYLYAAYGDIQISPGNSDSTFSHADENKVLLGGETSTEASIVVSGNVLETGNYYLTDHTNPDPDPVDPGNGGGNGGTPVDPGNGAGGGTPGNGGNQGEPPFSEGPQDQDRQDTISEALKALESTNPKLTFINIEDGYMRDAAFIDGQPAGHSEPPQKRANRPAN